MPDAPMPLKIVLGLAAAAVDEARKLPETLPSALTKAPVLAVTTAMGASLRIQQRLASLATRGEEVLSHVRGTPEEPPSWATFDDPPTEAEASADLPRAAFDLIDYDGTGFAEGDETRSRWDAVGAGEAEDDAAADSDDSDDSAPHKSAPKKAAKKSPAKKAPAKRAPRKESPSEVAEAMAVIAAAPPPATPAESAPTTKPSGPAAASPRADDLAEDLAADMAAAIQDAPEA